MPAFLRLIRFAKLVTLLAGLLTLLDLVLIVGWQAVTFFNNGSWPAVQLASIVKRLPNDRGAIYETASTPSGERDDLLMSATDTLQRIPAVVPLLLALALLVVFFSWLSRIEKQYT
jgi:hypothetical protein